MDWWSANATHGLAEHFGGGIISLKYSLPLLDAHDNLGLALKMHMQTDRAPGFGYWIETGGATTLWEQYDMTATEGTSSRNHIMVGGEYSRARARSHTSPCARARALQRTRARTSACS